MSRFDRRLKGGGLRPGQSTCKIRNTSNTKVMSSGFNNSQRMGGSNYATAYNPIIQPNAPQMQQQQQQQVPENNMKRLSHEDLLRQNRKLEQYALTAPSQELRTMTMHEIRLNKLEWINSQAELMMESEEKESSKKSSSEDIDMKLAQYTLTTLEPKLREIRKQGNTSSNSNNNSDELTVKFKNLNTVSMKTQTDVGMVKNEMKLVKATVKTFAGNLQRVHTLETELKNYKTEMEQLRSSYKKLKNDFELFVSNANSKRVELQIEDIEKGNKSMGESDVRDVVVKAIKEKSVN